MSRKSKAQGHSRGKRRTSKSRVTDKLHLDSTTDHTAAIVAHSKALKQHSQAIRNDGCVGKRYCRPGRG
jgi:hypothetical protein